MAAQAAAAAGTAAVDIGKGLFNNMEARKGAESARSCQVAIRNLTNETLIRAHRQCNYGEWTKENEAPEEIPGRDAGGFMFESHGLMTGCGGEANYEIGTTGETLKIFVSVPYSQANETRANIEGGSRFKVTTEGGNGKNVTYTIKLVDSQPEEDGDDEEGGDDNRRGDDDDDRNGDDNNEDEDE